MSGLPRRYVAFLDESLDVADVVLCAVDLRKRM
jgi:hypothetical protein